MELSCCYAERFGVGELIWDWAFAEGLRESSFWPLQDLFFYPFLSYLPVHSQSTSATHLYAQNTSQSSHLTTERNHNIHIRDVSAPIPGLGILHLTHNVHTFDYLTEDDVFVVQEGGRDCGYEELGSVAVGAGVLFRVLVTVRVGGSRGRSMLGRESWEGAVDGWEEGDVSRQG
jgi:hypothetical protein